LQSLRLALQVVNLIQGCEGAYRGMQLHALMHRFEWLLLLGHRQAAL
jgi:hypothetical protein